MDSTRTLLFGILVTAGRRLTAPQIVQLAKPLGISAVNVKSHLTRLVAEGALERAGPARRAEYWPSASQARVAEGIHARLTESPTKPWDRTWLVLTLRMPRKRAVRERLRALLWFDGFRPWAPYTFARPAWPEPWALRRAREHLACAPGLLVRGRLVGAAADLQALYQLDALDREAHRLARQIRRKRISARSPARAFAEQLVVGGLVARLVGHDPRLPRELWNGRSGLRELVAAFRRFEAQMAPKARRFLDDILKTPARR